MSSNDCKLLASGSGMPGAPGGEVKLWDMATCREKASLKAITGAVYSVGFSSDGKLLATEVGVRGRGEVKLWKASHKDRANWVTSLASGGGGKLLAALSGVWSGKLAGGGKLVLRFLSDGTGIWDVSVGGKHVSDFMFVGRVGQDCIAVIQDRRVTLRLTDTGRLLQVTGQNFQATLRKE
jgi:WD40 repeat protein